MRRQTRGAAKKVGGTEYGVKRFVRVVLALALVAAAADAQTPDRSKPPKP